MTEEELFKIQHEQVTTEIEKIKWIADNKDELIRALRKVVANSNSEYFDNENQDVNTIFRGGDINRWLTNYLLREITFLGLK
jgi:hypothetical protein|tara:strand:- start:451 stop:696 length:246 start_codon:yes stop_codon:yes gene_type:complete